MDKFNQQFATQKLREETGNNWPETITSRYQDEYLFIHDKSKPGFYTIQDVETGKTVGRVGFNTPKSAVEFAKDKIKPQGGRQSSGLGETSMTSAGATFTPGTGEQTAPRATKKIVKKKIKKEGANIPKDFTDAPSIPNRPSKAFVYKQLYEELSKALKEEYTETNLLNILDDIRSHIETSSDLDTGFKEFALPLLDTIDNNVQNDEWDDALLDLEYLDDSIRQVNRMEWEEVYSEMFEKAIRRVETLATEMEDDFYDDDGPVTDYGKEKLNPGSYEKDYQEKGTGDYFQRRSLDESYSKFKNQTKTRGKSDQFHQAVKEVKKKVLEINKMYEYVSRLKEELSEGGSALEYKMHTEKALHKIKEMVSELNKKIKRFK